jgi:hypothetical protein
VCGLCGRASQQGRGEAVAVGSEVVEMAACDAQVLPPPDGNGDGDGEGEAPTRRATQNVPPRVRREVMRRDGGHCSVPGCRHAVFLDVHHVVPRADGGGHDPDTLAVLCGAHHRALHRGTLIIEGRAHEGFRFRHADGTVYGGRVQPALAQAGEDAFAALRSLGFGETAARRALEAARASLNSPSVAEPGLLVKAALRALTPSGRVPEAPPTRLPSHVQERPAVYVVTAGKARRRSSLSQPLSMTHVGAHAGVVEMANDGTDSIEARSSRWAKRRATAPCSRGGTRRRRRKPRAKHDWA